MTTPIRVVLADDHALVRAGIRALLTGIAGIEVVGEAHDGHEIIELVDKLRPRLVLMDIAMPGLNGLEATARIVKSHPGTAVIILSMHAGEEYVLKALRAGAVGYLLKDAEPDDILNGIRAVARGESPIHPRAARELLDTRRPSADMPDLTPREREVLQLLARGLSNAELAAAFHLSEATVKTHVARILGKLQLRDRVQAVVVAYESGLIRPGTTT